MTSADGDRITEDDPHSSGLLRLRQDVVVERFEDVAVMLLVSDNHFVTTNLAAADLFEILSMYLGERVVSTGEIAAFLLDQYHLEHAQADAEARGVVEAWVQCGLLQMS